MSRFTPKWRIAAAVTLAAALLPGIGLASPAQASQTVHETGAKHHQAPDSGPAVHHDLSPTMASMAVAAGPAHGTWVAPDIADVLPHPRAARKPDPVVQSSPGVTTPNTATTVNFDGIGSATGYTVNVVPPDPDAAVGTTQVVEVVNAAYAVYSKTGAVVLAPTNTNTLWSGFGGYCQSTNDGDATVVFDHIANRWVVQQFSNARSATGPYNECVAVSTSADATGTYYRYAYQFTNFPDYPKLAVWPQAYFTTYNMFTPSGALLSAEICAMNRAAMLTGTAAAQQCFTTSSSYAGVLASDLDGPRLPPSGEDNTILGLGTTSTTLAAWKFHVDWTTPANSALTGPTALTVASYSPACGTSRTCIPQGGTTQLLDALGDRMMYRLAYRNFGDHESLVVNDSVTAATGVGIRWYELRLASGTGALSVYQQGTYAPDSTFRWMGSIAEDKAGDIALGYSQSSTATHPAIRFTSRGAGDTLGTMTAAESTMVAGAGSEVGYSRWGDYTSMSVDPTDDCTFWYTDEYEPTNGFNWQTRIAAFKLPACTPDFLVGVSPTSATVPASGSTTATVSTAALGGFTGTISLTASGVPNIAAASFSPTSVTAGGTSTMTLYTSDATTPGTYPITITATSGSLTHTAIYTVTVTPLPPETITVTNPGTQNGTYGKAVSLQIVATDSRNKPMSYTATGLPPGLTMNAFGLITGTPTATGTFNVVAMAHSDATSGTASFTWIISG